MGPVAPWPRSSAKAGVGVLVAGLHLAGLIAWLSMEHAPPVARNVGALATLSVWLPQLVLPVVPPARRESRQTAALEYPRLGADRGQLRVGEAAAGSSSAPAGDALVMEPAASGSQALNLNLSQSDLRALTPSGSAASSAIRPRLPPTVEQIMERAAAESGPWTEERVDNDHIRLRRGSSCVMMERPQAASVDSFSDAARRIPWRASRC